MAISTGPIDFESTTFKVLYTCVAFLLVKMLLMAPLTAIQRVSKKVVANPEDRFLDKRFKVKFDDPDVERVRRAHRNDLENILIFITIACWYVSLKPNPTVAIPLLILYTIARYAHTFIYTIKILPQPSRFFSFAIGYVITAYMAINIILTLKD